MQNQTYPRARLFYSRAWIYFSLALLIILLGFFPSYFTKLDSTDKAHHFHGISATLWLCLLILQPLLYRLGLMQWHRILGWTSLVVVPLVIAGGLLMVHIMLSSMSVYPPDIPYQLAFIDFFVLSQFLLFYLLAIRNRKNTQLHARYMACTVFGPLIPAITRALFHIPVIDSFTKSLNISYILVEIALIILLFDDKRSGKIRTPYVLALILMAVQHILMNFIHRVSFWRTLMDGYAGW